MEGHEMKPCVVCADKPTKNGKKNKFFFTKTMNNEKYRCYSRDPNKFTSELIKTVAFFPTSELFEIQRHIAKNSSFHPTGELIWYKDI